MRSEQLAAPPIAMMKPVSALVKPDIVEPNATNVHQDTSNLDPHVLKHALKSLVHSPLMM